jgi:ribosomal protein L3 glutamine methyltransferase
MVEHALLNLQQCTLAELITAGADYLQQSGLVYGHGTDNPYDESAWLVLEACGLSPVEPLPDGEVIVNRGHLERVKRWLQRRAMQREPVAYITGRAWFAGLEFDTDTRALIPRSPIAELIQQQYAPWVAEPPATVLDLCCGGGCIAIASALAMPQAMIHGCDLSADALQLAAQNREKHGVARQVEFFSGDLFEALPEHHCYDLIVSNPPYVDRRDMRSLPAEYQHEPSMGLEAGADGLDIVRRILRDAASRLTDDGVLIVEVGNSQPAVEAQFPELDLVWIEFEMGGAGVFTITARQLKNTQY